LHAAERRDAVNKVLREGDPDRYVATLFAPKSARESLFALYALNVELARVAELVTEPGLGEIRLEWWREALARAAKGEATGSPVADAAGLVLKEHSHAEVLIGQMIDARRFDVAVKIMPDWLALDAYLDATAGNLFALASEITGSNDNALAPAAKAAGIAYGLTGLMRALPVHAARGRVDLPEDELLRHGTSPDRVLAGEASPGLTTLLAELRGRARDALHQAKRRTPKLAPAERSAFLPLCLVEPYLAALAEVEHDPFRSIVTINPLYRLWRMATWR
jgi:phytoene synthase